MSAAVTWNTPDPAIIVKLVLILKALGLVVSEGPVHCPVVQLKACTAPLIDAVTRSSSAFPLYSDPELTQLCRSCGDLPRCLQQVGPLYGCPDHQLHYIEEIQLSCSYFCQEGLTEYRIHRGCFNNSALQREGAACNQSLTEREMLLANVNERKYSRQDQHTLMCQYYSDFVTCMRDAVTSHCTSEAGEWVFRSFSQNMERMECHSGSKVGVAIIFGTAIGLFTIMLIVIITSIMCRRKQAPSSRITSDQFNTFSNVSKEPRGCKWNNMNHHMVATNIRRKSESTTYVSLSPQKSLGTPRHEWNQCAIENSPQETMGLLTSHRKDENSETQSCAKKNINNQQDIELVKIGSKTETC